MNFPRVVAVLLLAGTASAGAAESAERHYWIGVHDFAVPDVDSHTYGIDDDLMIRVQFTVTR